MMVLVYNESGALLTIGLRFHYVVNYFFSLKISAFVAENK